MSIITAILVVVGLCLFETVSSIDNAIINAEILSGMSKRARRWFLTWGVLFAVFVPRGILPWLVIWLTTPALGPLGALTATFSGDPRVLEALHASSPLLLMAGGVFLVLLFLYWLFLEEKSYGIIGEKFFYERGVWFYAVASVMLAVVVWFALKISSLLAFAAVIGSAVFFITHGFKQNAAEQEKRLLTSAISDLSKLLYLEILDLTFSVDGVLGAFAFTLAVPLILVGNGLGALVVRQLTVSNIDRIKRYRYLKNGAMYSILCLGAIMMTDGFGATIPEWVSPLITFVVVGFFFVKSASELRRPKVAVDSRKSRR